MGSEDLDAWTRAGLYDPAAAGAEDRLALLQLLTEDGCSLSDMVAAEARGRLFGLAGDRRIWPGPGVHTVAQAGALAGLSVDEVRTVGSALALYLPAGEAPALTSADVEALQTYGDLRTMVGQDAALGVLRVIGAATARVAEAAAVIMRSRVDEIAVSRSGSEERTARAFREVAALVPRLGQVLDLVHRRHIEQARRHLEQLVGDEGGLLCGIGFADVSGYTALSEVLSLEELSRLLMSFEVVTSTILYEAGARVVKFIGDAVMFTAPTPDLLVDVSLRIVHDPVLADADIELRAAAAWGPVLAQDGDYYGSTVNLAARLLAAAHPGQLVVSPSLAEHLDGHRWTTESLPAIRLRGFDKAVAPTRVTAVPPGRVPSRP